MLYTPTLISIIAVSSLSTGGILAARFVAFALKLRIKNTPSYLSSIPKSTFLLTNRPIKLKNNRNNSNKNSSQYTEDLLVNRIARVVPLMTNKQILSTHRHYSTNSPVVPVVVYRNADLEKLRITRENKGKCGVYR